MSTAQLADEQHPWIGLSSFTEDDRAFFAGRGEEIDELLRLVRRDTLTLLYGVSGLGKTSLLQAGLFPALRAEDYLPVPIRLDYMDGAAPITQQVLSAIAKASVAASVEAPAPLPAETLWEYFHRESNHFWSPRNDLVTPFLVFDQFEECFTLGRETAGRERRGAAFITELADLVENRPPAALRGDLQRAREFDLKPRPLRVLLAMREDYLAELDRIRSQFRALGKNRLRLLPMGMPQAREVIDLGAALIAPGVEDRIVRFVAGSGAAADDGEITVAPALLSLVLQQLNERRLEQGADAKITAELLDLQQKKIFEDFYLRTLKPLDPGVRTFIEDRLLTASGFRNSCALDDALSCSGVTQPALDELVNSRLLAYEDRARTRRVEITHDVLAPVIRTSRDTRLTREALADAERKKAEAREKERVARHRLLVVGSLLVLSVIAGASFGLWKASLAKAETAKANEQTAWAEELQEQMTEQATQGELTAANDLKLEEEWASRLLHLDRALSYSGTVHYSQQNAASAAKWANRRAKQHATAAAALWAELRYGAASRAPLIRAFIDSKTTMIQHMVWSPKEPLLATAGFGDVLLWSFSGRKSTDVSPQRCELTDPSTGDVTGLRFSADGKTLLVVRNKRWELISVAKKKLIFTSPATELLLAGDAFSPDGMQVVTRPEGGAPHIIRTEIPDDPGAPVSISQIEIPVAPGVDLAGPSSKGVVVAWSPKGDRIALADEKRMISVYSISKAGVTLLLPNAIEAFADVAPLRAAINNAIEVKGLSFDESGDLLLVKDEKGINPLFEIWTVNSTGAKRLDRAPAKFRAWMPKRSVLLDIPIGDGPPVISNAQNFRKGRELPIKDPGAPRFSTDGPAALFIQSKRNYQVLDLETGYPVTPPFGWWYGPITARLALSPGLIASVENKSELAFWDLRPEQRRWHADPPQPPQVAPVSGPHMKWKGSSSFSVGDLIDHLSLTKKLIARSDPVSQFVWEHVSAESRKALTDPASTSISAADLIDPSSLAEKLIASSGPVSQFVWEHFSPNSKKVLIDPASVAEEKQGALVEELNKVLKGGPIYLDKRFEKVTLSSETLALKAKNPQGEDLALLNRLLLEDAYRPEFSRKKRDTLVEQLNKVLNAGPIYSDKRFENVTLSGETLALKAKNPQGEDLALLNRLLLEDAYPLEFRRNRWIADISVDQRVVVALSDDDGHLLVVISLDEQPTSAGWSADSRYLRIYSKVRGFIDLEWDPPTVIEEPIHKLVELLIRRKDPNKAPAERFELRKEMPKWKAKDPRWQKLLDWWTAGRPDEVPNPNAQLLTDIPSDGAISPPPVDRDDPNSSVWVFHDSNTRPLTEADLRLLSDDELWTARNEIFARRGAKIGGDRGRSLIKKLGPEFHDSGIKPDDAYDLMNGIEKANILLIKSIESQRQTGQ